MRKPGIIALDLDGTLLNSEKILTPENEAALRRAAEEGIEIVPATGRFYRGMPECIRDLPYVHYAITINGAEVTDVRRKTALVRAELPTGTAIRVMEELDRLPVIYDCYADGWGYMTRALYEKAAEYAPTRHNLDMILNLRTPVPELKAYLRETGYGVQKIQAFFLDQDLRKRTMENLAALFPDTAVSTSIVNNIEINSRAAQKGFALRSLAEAIGVDPADTMAFGDDLNDLSMIEAAGIGVAMANGAGEVREKADYVAPSCDENGVAAALADLLWRKEDA